ncbi:MAG: gamma-glutamyl-gamma-aminobutyrate hydrolase family protein [Lachnospiraceae bacterium]|nr:gamma-glutamyl-gamma-aminobutyrate hydrolase family protein [Lachnospiraceae bacterium]
MKIAILGRKKDTHNYVNYVKRLSCTPLQTLSPGEAATCDMLILPGGGDITPAFYGEEIDGSFSIDTELDVLQLQAFEYAMKCKMPVLGICKGMQLINVDLGGTMVQDISTPKIHRSPNGDQYHNTHIVKGSFLYDLYGEEAVVNSAHHQCVKQLGKGLIPIQWCPEDNILEAFSHESLPVLGVQWHPERIKSEFTTTSGDRLLAYFLERFT